jgi:hypothetical protein
VARSPFLTFGQPNTSGRRKGPDNMGEVKESDTGVGYTTGPDTPLAVTGDHHESDVNAYRGIDVHGVAHGPKWNDVDPITPDDAVVEFEIPDKEPDPIPVRIVTGNKSQELVRANVTHAYAVPNQQQRLIARDLNRKTCKITNLHATDTVWISTESGVQPYTGYPIKPGVEFTVTANNAMWCVAGGTNQIELAVYSETAIAE